jgi:hypothetical protein
LQECLIRRGGIQVWVSVCTFDQLLGIWQVKVRPELPHLKTGVRSIAMCCTVEEARREGGREYQGIALLPLGLFLGGQPVDALDPLAGLRFGAFPRVYEEVDLRCY